MAYMYMGQVTLKAVRIDSYNQANLDPTMTALSSFLSVNGPCDETLRWLNRRLTRLGLRVLQTFDLQDARLPLEDCTCPHHGTDDCDCQMVVVLVYGKASEPATLMLHGHDGQTWISLVDRPDQVADASLVAAMQGALTADRATSGRASP